MIPKVIHYCWFGHNPLPKQAKHCIETWKKNFPNYEIKEWNESNFDVNLISYTQEAYQLKKYAFVSDYARYWILYNYGGLYFDTDVEVLKPFEDILENGAFMGFEQIGDNLGGVNPGLGLGCEKGHPFVGKIIDEYSKLHYIQSDGTPYPKTIVHYTTDLLKDYNLQHADIIQKVAGFTIYPTEYFCPLPYGRTKINITQNTHSIHLYDSTWKPAREKLKIIIASRFPFITKTFYRNLFRQGREGK